MRRKRDYLAGMWRDGGFGQRPVVPGPTLSQRGAVDATDRITRGEAAALSQDVEIEVVDAPVELESAQQCLRFEQESFVALHQTLSGLDQTGRQAAWEEIDRETRPISAFPQ